MSANDIPADVKYSEKMAPGVGTRMKDPGSNRKTAHTKEERNRLWRNSRGYDRKSHTMRKPPPGDEAQNLYTEEFYDLMSITNVRSTGVDSEEDYDNKRRIMRDCIKRLGDRMMSAEARVNALDILASLLMNSRSKEMLANQNEELFEAVVRPFGKTTGVAEDEMFRALRVLGLLSLHEGLNNDDYVRKLLQHIGSFPDSFQNEGTRPIDYRTAPPVSSRAKKPYTEDSVRCEAMATIAIATFFCASEEDLIERALDIVENVLCRLKNASSVTEDGPQGVDETLTRISDAMRGAAADSWCMIAMRLEPSKILSRVQTKVIHALRNLLFSDDLDTRVAGGEAIAFLYELAEEASESDEAPEIWLSPDRDIWVDIIDQLDFLSGEYDRRLSRRERREQHKMFRAFHKTVTEGHYPLEVLKLPESEFSVETWGGVKILDFIRHFTGRGFHEGLYHFQSVQDVLGMPDWMRKVVSREHDIRDEQIEHNRIANKNVFVEDGSDLPKVRASRKFQARKKEHRYRTQFADQTFPSEYDAS